ncbi:MAG TPA: YbhB/YbcL family Raf kinase inhibitor-like protein [Acidimicrobiales bacterium]|nr:YbhB/YbcL family Raf kinase inhibitor-like protein [Acidimicrobiales bacterium]
MAPLDVLTVAVLAWFGSRLVIGFRRAITGPARAHSLTVVRGLRLRHFAPVPLVLASVLATATLLTSIPPFDFGWWTAIGGQGNPAFGVTERTAGTSLEVIIPLVFVVLLIPALPLFVEREEQLFRLGAETWSTPKRVGKALLFGLVHAVIGIPVGVALALSLGGAWFTVAYLHRWRRTGSRRQALFESTRCHLAYNSVIVGIVAVLLAVEAVWLLTDPGGQPAGRIRVTSTAFAEGATIPERFSCEGDNVAPPLAWSGVPDGAVELAVVVSDPDAPGGTFHHWLLLGLDPALSSLETGTVPAGAVEGEASSGKATYIGPCPPDGSTHRYRFTVYALDRPLGLPAGVAAGEALRAIRPAVIGEGRLTGRFSR